MSEADLDREYYDDDEYDKKISHAARYPDTTEILPPNDPLEQETRPTIVLSVAQTSLPYILSVVCVLIFVFGMFVIVSSCRKRPENLLPKTASIIQSEQPVKARRFHRQDDASTIATTKSEMSDEPLMSLRKVQRNLSALAGEDALVSGSLNQTSNGSLSKLTDTQNDNRTKSTEDP